MNGFVDFSTVIAWLEKTANSFENDEIIPSSSKSETKTSKKRKICDMEGFDQTGRTSADRHTGSRDVFVLPPSRCRSTSPTKRPRCSTESHYSVNSAGSYASPANNSPTKSEVSMLRNTLSSARSQSTITVYSTEETSVTAKSETTANKASEKNKRIALSKTTVPSVHFGIENYYRAGLETATHSSKTKRAFQSILSELSIEDELPSAQPSVAENPPMVVTSLIREFSVDKAVEGCVPMGLRAWATQTSPQDYFPKYCFDKGCMASEQGGSNVPSRSSEPADRGDLSCLQDRLKLILQDAQKLVATNQREEKWYSFVASILDMDMEDAGARYTQNGEIKVQQVHGSSIRTDLLPKKRFWDGSTGDSIQTSKVDILLYLNEKNKTVSRMLEMLRKAGVGQQPGVNNDSGAVSFTFLSDTAESDMFPLCPVEVKTSFGHYAMASYQLAIAFCSQLTLLERLFPRAFEDPENPVIVAGWTVVAHEWSIHLGYKSKDGNVVMAGPYNAGNTVTLFGLFKLLKVIDTVKRWSIESFFGRLLKCVLQKGK